VVSAPAYDFVNAALELSRPSAACDVTEWVEANLLGPEDLVEFWDPVLLSVAFSGAWDLIVPPPQSRAIKEPAKASFRRACATTPLTDWLRRMPRAALPRAALPAWLAITDQPRELALVA